MTVYVGLKYYKYVYEDWEQPVLTANGTMGGDSFAVSSNVSQYSGNDVYYLFNGNTTTSFHSTSGVTTGYIDLYNHNPLKITNILVNNQNASQSANRASTAGNIYGSNNGSDWELITSYTNTVQGINEQWNIDLSSNTKGYKYYRIESTEGSTGGYWTIGELTITAQEQHVTESTKDDYDYVAPNKIKDISSTGVYLGSQNTNCLTYTPKNINLELNNGTLTLKAGSKVYVPNGFEADGVTPKFDYVTIESDKVRTGTINQTGTSMAYLSSSGTLIVLAVAGDGVQNNYFSGATAPTSTNYMTWYDTATNIVKTTSDKGATWNSNASLPLGVVSYSSKTASFTSIDQIFDWCGYIGSTAFVLPGVKGLIPNGFNADGTYKSTEFETDRVLTHTATSTEEAVLNIYNDANVPFDIATYTRSHFFKQDNAPTAYQYMLWYDTKTNIMKYTENTGASWIKVVLYNVADIVTSSGVITSLTPATVKPLTTVIPVKEIYNGSELVYQYKQPGEVLFEKSTAGTYTFTAPYNCTVDVVIVGGGGGGSDSWGGNRRTGGSGAMITGSIVITKGTTYTIVVGGGGAYGYGSAVDKPGQGKTGGTTSAFGNNAYGGAGGYTHSGWGAVIANNGAGGSFSVVSGFTGSAGVEGSTANRYGNYGGGGFGSANGAGGYVRITLKR